MSRRLSDDRVRAIQRAAEAGTLTITELAAEFGVGRHVVARVIRLIHEQQTQPKEESSG